MLREDKEEKTQGAEGDGRVKDREPAAIKMSPRAEADAHLSSTNSPAHLQTEQTACALCWNDFNSQYASSTFICLSRCFSMLVPLHNPTCLLFLQTVYVLFMYAANAVLTSLWFRRGTNKPTIKRS